jgi:hypothetical protein
VGLEGRAEQVWDPRCDLYAKVCIASQAALDVPTPPSLPATPLRPGLDIEKDTILELACIVTNGDLDLMIEVGG